jgi:hypothetical protein
MKLLSSFKKSPSNIFILRRKTPKNIRITKGRTTFKENIRLFIIESFLLHGCITAVIWSVFDYSVKYA